MCKTVNPLAALGCVRRICTEMATLACTPQGLRLIDTVDGLSRAELENLLGLPIMEAERPADCSPPRTPDAAA